VTWAGWRWNYLWNVIEYIQLPYQAVYRASYSGLKDNPFMVYLPEINQLSLIDEGGIFAAILASTRVIASINGALACL